MSEETADPTNHKRRARELEALYDEIYTHYAARDPELVPRVLFEGSLDSRVVLLGQALAKDTQRRSGIPYCFPPASQLRLSNGGRVLDAFLAWFGYTIDPRIVDRHYAHHTDLAHYFPGKKAASGDLVPSAREVRHDREWFERELVIIRPAVVVALGKEPALEFSRRYLGRDYSKLRDVPVEPMDTDIDGLSLQFVAVHHPSGAYQHPSSVERYEQVARYIEEILER
jgi:uracil-DNA glycosylase family 4